MRRAEMEERLKLILSTLELWAAQFEEMELASEEEDLADEFAGLGMTFAGARREVELVLEAWFAGRGTC